MCVDLTCDLGVCTTEEEEEDEEDFLVDDDGNSSPSNLLFGGGASISSASILGGGTGGGSIASLPSSSTVNTSSTSQAYFTHVVEDMIISGRQERRGGRSCGSQMGTDQSLNRMTCIHTHTQALHHTIQLPIFCWKSNRLNLHIIERSLPSCR